MEKFLNKPDSEDDMKVLLTEIADLLNISVSLLEHYPSDLQKLLCQIYVDNYDSDDDSKRFALTQIIALNTQMALRKIINKTKQPNIRSENITRKNTYFLTRKIIMKNAKIISGNLHSNQMHEQNPNYSAVKQSEN